MTGFSDPVYAEAYVNVNQYDIVLDVLVVNQTADTLQVYISPVPRREDHKCPGYALSDTCIEAIHSLIFLSPLLWNSQHWEI